jgi:hypothetical protein
MITPDNAFCILLLTKYKKEELQLQLQFFLADHISVICLEINFTILFVGQISKMAKIKLQLE